MKNLIFLFSALVVSAGLYAKEHAIELGVGGSAYQINHIPYVNVRTGEDRHVVNMKLKDVAYTGTVTLAAELSNVFALDARASIGSLCGKPFILGTAGMQMRMGYWFGSSYIDPYIRVGIGFGYEGYDIPRLEDNYTIGGSFYEKSAVRESFIPITAGAGVNMWMNDNWGIGISGDYLYIEQNRMDNSLAATVTVMYRFGGKSKKPQSVVRYVDRPIDHIVEKVVERKVEVEKIVGRTVVKENPSRLLSQITFDYDSYTIDAKYEGIIRDAAALMKGRSWLITGFTDIKGSIEYNESLSLKRAQAVRDALIEAGVEAVKAIGVGERIANAGSAELDSVRRQDRKIYVEEITNNEYWNIL